MKGKNLTFGQHQNT